MPDPVFRSPLATTAVAAPDGRPAQVVLREVRHGGMALVAAWPETLDRVAAVLDGHDCVMALAPGRFMVVGWQADPVPALRAALTIDAGAVTDIGHARTAIRVSGPRAADVLQKGLAIDLAPATFPPGAAAQSAIHHVGVVARRCDAEAFELYCFRGFALSLWEWLADAALEYGFQVDPGAD